LKYIDLKQYVLAYKIRQTAEKQNGCSVLNRIGEQHRPQRLTYKKAHAANYHLCLQKGRSNKEFTPFDLI
jgi:hypothetical protein